jgi:DNA-binding beta-propeller fold protein YncE
MKRYLVASAALFVFASAGAARATAHEETWVQIAKYTLGGAGGWDLMAVDAKQRRLYLTRGDRVMVIDPDTGRQVGELVGLEHAHGVALVPGLHRGYVTSGGADRVVSFDLGTLKPLHSVEVGKNPDAIVFDRVSGDVFAFDGGSHEVTIIDPRSDKVVATLELPGKPELAVTDDRGNVYVNLEDEAKVSKIDARRRKVVATWPLGTCEEPTGLAIDRRHRRLFSACANRQMAILDARDGRVVQSVPIGERPDGAAFDPATSDAFSSNSDGTLTVVHENGPDHFMVAATVPTPPRSRTIVLDGKTHRVILATAEFEPAPADPHRRPAMKAGSFGVVVIGRP